MLSDLRTKNYDPLLTGAEPIIFVLSAGDIPFAFIVDCIALPFDLHKDRSNTRKLDALLNVYLPGYRLVESDEAGEGYAASSALLSPLNEKTIVNWHFSDDLKNLLTRSNIKILTAEEAKDLDALMDMLFYGHVLSAKWERRANYKAGSWHVVVMDKKSNEMSLGRGREFVVNEHAVLQRIK